MSPHPNLTARSGPSGRSGQFVAEPASAPAAAAVAPVSLHVDRLVLHGLPLQARDGARVQRAFEHEMARLLGAGSFAARQLHADAVQGLRLGPIRVGDGRDPERLGRELARVLQREWTR
ncbi:MAG: hypothetical protein KGL99_17040 [Burkholderiales bacterium]|nr:hypothetical protein [Burkholderiales bacterium]MDE2298961.1 hypothetical protein [Burkholderiales bacterium]MDE2628852.1 hypothetical protein [Burkholderiales bacterium]